jgi:serine/threonine protein kinase
MVHEGDTLVGNYRLMRLLGQGRFGQVWEASREDGGRVALKMPLPGQSGWSPRHMQREFVALRQVQHPNVVQAIDLLPSGGGLALELVDGVDLLEWVRGDLQAEVNVAPRKNLPMVFGQVLQEEGTSAFQRCSDEGLRRLLSAIGSLASALASIHKAGWIHLDLTPANLRVTTAGRPLVLDMGLAVQAAELPAGKDMPDRLIGSAPYLAPELGASPPSFACDWYSFGVVVFEALTGQLPFEGGGPDVFVRKRSIEAPRARELVSGVPSKLDEACARWLARSPLRRAGYDEAVKLLETSS